MQATGILEAVKTVDVYVTDSEYNDLEIEAITEGLKTHVKEVLKGKWHKQWEVNSTDEEGRQYVFAKGHYGALMREDNTVYRNGGIIDFDIGNNGTTTPIRIFYNDLPAMISKGDINKPLEKGTLAVISSPYQRNSADVLHPSYTKPGTSDIDDWEKYIDAQNNHIDTLTQISDKLSKIVEYDKNN